MPNFIQLLPPSQTPLIHPVNVNTLLRYILIQRPSGLHYFETISRSFGPNDALVVPNHSAFVGTCELLYMQSSLGAATGQSLIVNGPSPFGVWVEHGELNHTMPVKA